ncbi:hypothetical protein ACFXGT_18265 [Streptomyces sp. NPDC059352]|uniref:hypothetical protein n=1 Tax=Streptomyces sp. NPDC059352 TaxID=3346810 RepID=UPI003698949F
MSASARRYSPRVLPSERLTPRRQLLMLDAMAEVGGPDLRSMSVQDIAGLIGVSVKSVSRTVPFLLHTGLLQGEGRAWSLTELAFRLTQLRTADTARARLLLRDRWHDSWFHKVALKQLASGPLEDEKLAQSLSAGLPGPYERGLYLTEWMAYALLLDRDEQKRFILPAEQDTPPRTTETTHTAPFGVLDPLLGTPTERISALPDGDFIALMGAYRTVFASLASQSSHPTGH